MTYVSCPDRDRIIAATGHVLVTGGPGCGKTTVALRKALVRIKAGLEPGQKILFLSFSRAAIARIAQAAHAHTGLPRESRQHLEIQTFHSFFWQIVRGHAYLLGVPTPVRLLPPYEERKLRNGEKDDDPIWDAERDRLFSQEGRVVFDLFALKALVLLQGSEALRRIVANRYPLIIVDEAQDTGTEQWACIETLSGFTQVVCLADLDQQIYDFRRDVSPERLKQIMQVLGPLEVDLGCQNNRSPGVEIVKFGNDILANAPRGASYNGVSHFSFPPNVDKRDLAIRKAIGIISQRVFETTGRRAESIGYLTNWGKGVSIIARALQGGDTAKSILHRVETDEAEMLLAKRVIAHCMDEDDDTWGITATGLELIAEFFLARGDVKKADQLNQAVIDARIGCMSKRANCPKGLLAIIDQIHANHLSGNPTHDWYRIRQLFESSNAQELKEIARNVTYLMSFNRGRRIADALTEVWLRYGRYRGARSVIEAAINEDQIIGSDGDLVGVNVMTMHKSKGKEFDGVVILHLGNISPLCSDKEAAPYTKSRRLLRVAITRAKHHVLLLTDRFNPSPLLKGHKLA